MSGELTLAGTVEPVDSWGRVPGADGGGDPAVGQRGRRCRELPRRAAVRISVRYASTMSDVLEVVLPGGPAVAGCGVFGDGGARRAHHSRATSRPRSGQHGLPGLLWPSWRTQGGVPGPTSGAHGRRAAGRGLQDPATLMPIGGRWLVRPRAHHGVWRCLEVIQRGNDYFSSCRGRRDCLG